MGNYKNRFPLLVVERTLTNPNAIHLNKGTPNARPEVYVSAVALTWLF